MTDLEMLTTYKAVPIKDFPDYYISKDGKVYSLRRHTVPLLMNPTKHGTCKNRKYFMINLRKDGKYYQKYVHALVAEAFCPKSVGDNIVHHINNNTFDNNCLNLVWVSQRMHKLIHKERHRRLKEELAN